MGIKSLVAMQLKDKIDLSYLKSIKQTIFKIVFSLLEFAVLTAVIYFVFFLLSFLRLTSLFSGIPTNFFSIIFSIMIILSFVVCSTNLAKSLYLASDNQFLLTMPTSRLSVFASKLIVYIIYEFKRNLTYILPLLVAYGLINGMPFYYFLWLIPATILITLFTASIGALFSIPILFILLAIKKHNSLGYTFLFLFICLVVIITIFLISLIPNDIDLVANWGTIFWDIQDFFNYFVNNFSALYFMAVAFVGTRYGVVNILFGKEQLLALLFVVGVIVVVFSISILLVRPLFFKMASKPFEYTKQVDKAGHKNNVSSAFAGSLKKEILMTLRDSDKFSNLLIVCLVLPIAILLLNKIFGAMNTRLSGTYMTMAFNILMILLVTLSSNGLVAKIYSEEGRASYINKISPIDQRKILLSKLIINLVLVNTSILISTIIFGIFAKLNWINIIATFLILSLIYSSHLFYSASLDLMNPQIEQYATTGTHTNNPNENKSLMFSFLISAITAYLFYFLISENVNTAWIKILIVSAAFFAYNLYMYLSKIEVYYKEKQ